MSEQKLALLKKSPTTILITKIKRKLAKHRAVLDAFLNDIDVPRWYRGLSVFQLAAANKLYYALRDDGEQKTAYRTRECLLCIGLSPCIEMKPIRFLMRLSRLNDIAFLWFLMELHYKMPSASYSMNEQLIMSVIAHLDMITTLRELNRILPSPQLPKNEVPRKRPEPEQVSSMDSIRRSIRQSIRESINRTHVTVKTQKRRLPYFDVLKPRELYTVKLTSKSPGFRVSFNTYDAYRDPTHVVHNESNRWYTDYQLSASNRIAHRVIYDEVERVMRNFKALTLQADVVQTLCSHHQVIQDLEHSLEMQLQVVAKERCLNHFNLLKDPSEAVRERVTSQLEKDVRMYMKAFKRQAERSRKSSVIQILSKQNIHESTMDEHDVEFEPCGSPDCDVCGGDDDDGAARIALQAKKRVSYKDQLATGEKVECGVNTDLELTRFVKDEEQWGSNEPTFSSYDCPTLHSEVGHHCLHVFESECPHSHNDECCLAHEAHHEQCQSQFFEYYRQDDYNPCQHGDCPCSVRVGCLAESQESFCEDLSEPWARGQERLSGGQERFRGALAHGYGEIWFPKGVRGVTSLPERPAAEPIPYIRSYANIRTLQIRKRAAAKQKKSARSSENLQSFSLRSMNSSGRHGHAQNAESELFFEAAAEHKPYTFNYRNIFRFKENTPDNLAIRRHFIEAIDTELKNLNRLHDSQLDLRGVASADAKRLWAEEVAQRNMRTEEEHRRYTLANPNVLGYNKPFYDPDNKQLMRQMLKDALEYMSQNPKFVLASMPDAYKIPMLLEWTAFRFGKVYTRRERFNEFRLSLNVMKTLNDHLLDIRLPRSSDIGARVVRNFKISYAKRERIISKVKKMKRRYNHALNHSLMRHTRVFWFAMRPYLCGAQTGNTFFAYMPSRVSEILRFRAWKPHEHRRDFEGWQSRHAANHTDLLDFKLEHNDKRTEKAC